MRCFSSIRMNRFEGRCAGQTSIDGHHIHHPQNNKTHLKARERFSQHLASRIVLFGLQSTDSYYTLSAMNQSLNLVILVLAFVLAATTAFQPPQRTVSSSLSTSSTSLQVVWDPKHNDEHQSMLLDDDPLVEFPTAAQRVVLKKEAAKRQARKKLASYSLPSSEQLGSFSDETLEQVWDLLQENELIQVRGFAAETEEKKLVYSLALKLCSQLEWEQERQINDVVSLPVALLSTKGHSAILYSPTLDQDDPKKFVLRTSVGQKNAWTARIKPPRDERGQIIRE